MESRIDDYSFVKMLGKLVNANWKVGGKKSSQLSLDSFWKQRKYQLWGLATFVGMELLRSDYLPSFIWSKTQRGNYMETSKLTLEH